MKTKLLMLFLLFLTVTTSCRDDMPDMQNPSTALITNWKQLFESYWSGMNYHYVFWDIDSTDWDAMYTRYKPKFDSIVGYGFTDGTINAQAFEWIKEMSSTLIDGHLSIQVKINDESGESYRYSPSDKGIENREDYHGKIADYICRYILPAMNREGRFHDAYMVEVVNGNDRRYYASGLMDSDILYLGFSSFSISDDASDAQYAEEMDRLFSFYHDNLDNNPNLRGVIIDVRSNEGGNASELSSILGKFISEPMLFSYSRMKSGPGRLDYTSRTPNYLQPYEYKRALNIPVVLLTDMHSFSMAEAAAMAVKRLPGGNGVVMGQQTGGATGNIMGLFEGAYSGPFANDVLSVFTCTSMLVDADGVSYEGRGVPPDIEVRLDMERFLNQDEDNQLEAAIEYIKSGGKR